MNARYALNAANARWGSLYDALYGTDAIPEADGAERGKGYNPERGAKVVAWAKSFLDGAAPLDGASWADVDGLRRSSGSTLQLSRRRQGRQLRDAGQFAGYRGAPAAPDARAARATTACISRSSSTAPTRSARPIRPASPMSCWKRR